MDTIPQEKIPNAFIWRRLHSLAGIWLVGYLIIHLFTNSQAAFFFGNDGSDFIRAVNAIHEMPYLPIIEIAILGVPIFIHAWWGIKYIRTAEYNSFGNTGHTPYLPDPKNRAFTWQRITSWLLLIGIVAHVIHMRIVEYPMHGLQENQHAYMVRVSRDEGLYSLSKRLGVKLYDQHQIGQLEKEALSSDSSQREASWINTLNKKPLREHELLAVADNFGTVELLMVRDTFKSPLMITLYTLLVLAACFHAFNGLWTAMISWGITLNQRSQRLMRFFSIFLMIVVTCLGLAAVWFSYWINLRQ